MIGSKCCRLGSHGRGYQRFCLVFAISIRGVCRQKALIISLGQWIFLNHNLRLIPHFPLIVFHLWRYTSIWCYSFLASWSHRRSRSPSLHQVLFLLKYLWYWHISIEIACCKPIHIQLRRAMNKTVCEWKLIVVSLVGVRSLNFRSFVSVQSCWQDPLTLIVLSRKSVVAWWSFGVSHLTSSNIKTWSIFHALMG